MRCAVAVVVFGMTSACAPGALVSSAGGEVVGGVTTVASTDFRSPENVVYDAASDVYLISNINGDPGSADGNGFISRVAPDGKVIALKWIDGARRGVALDAPKGLALLADTLFVADIGAVRMFDRRTGAPLGSRAIPGRALNDVAFDMLGRMYITDTGPDRGGATVDTSRDIDAVFAVAGSAGTTAIARGLDLQRPDGIVATDSAIFFTTFGGNHVERLSRTGGRSTVATLPGGKVDGLRMLSDGSLLVTSWDARAVYRLMPNGERRLIASNIPSPAGVAYDAKRNRVVITSMTGNRVLFAPLGALP